MTYGELWVTVRSVQINPAALKAIREHSGHSQLSLAEASGVNQGHISKLESTEGAANIRPATVKKLADALGVPTAALTVPEAVAS